MSPALTGTWSLYLPTGEQGQVKGFAPYWTPLCGGRKLRYSSELAGALLQFSRFAMDVDRWDKIAEIYDRACEQPVRLREAFLVDACKGDEELRREVQSLLRQGTSQDGPLERVAEHARTAWDCPSKIGNYRIIGLIGEGGMGAVYEAEQERPRRNVALKVLRSPLSAPELQRRFVHEAEVLGRLQHPNIAQIYEAGTAQTDLGPLPYFAMEFVRGASLLEYKDRHRLSISQCVHLMITICEAVDYAHRCGVIHRDIKPGNILVDESGQPKILDFGVARVDSDASLTRQTHFGDLVGTLAYMSPEQLLADPRLVDARSDVYSMGIVLYELLTGRRPYDVSREITDAARIIREEDPIPLGATNRALAGDLETVLAKALEKDRERRYASAADLSADLRRFLAHQPVLARPASAAYRARKFVRRHRVLVSAAATIFVVLSAGIIATTSLAIRARNERDRALRAEQIAKAVNDFLQNDLLAQAGARAQASTHSQPDPDLKVRTALDRAAARIDGKFDSQPAVEAATRRTIGLAYYDMNLFPQAQVQLERVVDLRKRSLGPEHTDTLTSMDELAVLYTYQSKYAAAETLLKQVVETRQRLFGNEHKDTLAAMSDLALAIAYQGDDARAAPIFATLLDADKRILGEENPATLSVLDNLAGTYRQLGRYVDAQMLLQREVELNRRILGPEHPDTANSVLALGSIYRLQGDYKAADTLLLQGVESLRRSQGERHWATANALKSLAMSYRGQRRYREADAVFKQALATLRGGLGPQHPLTLQLAYGLAESYRQQRRFNEAELTFTQVLEGRRRALGNDSRYTAEVLGVLGETKLQQHSYEQAERFLREALQIREQKTPDAWERYQVESMLGATLLGLRKYSEARPLLIAGYRGMLQRQSSIPAEYQQVLEKARAWASQP